MNGWEFIGGFMDGTVWDDLQYEDGRDGCLHVYDTKLDPDRVHIYRIDAEARRLLYVRSDIEPTAAERFSHELDLNLNLLTAWS
jgi:hypothetical protein